MIFNYEQHSFHIVEESIWPLLVGSISFCFFFSFVLSFNGVGDITQLGLCAFSGLFVLALWSRDIIRETSYCGSHTYEIEQSLKWGMAWFISSEIFFFFAFFWGFFHCSLSAVVESGNSWPPIGVYPLEAFAVPLLNTFVLLSSGVSLTWAHHSILSGRWGEGSFGFVITIFLGIYFTFLQLSEYAECSFSMSDSMYGSIFFLATGFHGFHVCLGTFLLALSALRLFQNHHYGNHHVGLETASWYWHFVDVVWLFLFCCVYWWGS